VAGRACQELHDALALPAETAGAITRALAAERKEALARALAVLSGMGREILVLRGIEGHA